MTAYTLQDLSGVVEWIWVFLWTNMLSSTELVQVLNMAAWSQLCIEPSETGYSLTKRWSFAYMHAQNELQCTGPLVFYILVQTDFA